MKEEIELNKLLSYYGRQCITSYDTVLLVALGRRLGIFDYLYKANKIVNKDNRFVTITFTPDEIIRALEFNPKIFDGWLHLAIEFGLLEVDHENKGYLMTAPHVYELFIDPESDYYLGYVYGWAYKASSMQSLIFESFKSGKIIERLDGDIIEESSRDGNIAGKPAKILRLKLFSTHLKDYHQRLMNGGRLLEIGCAIGTSLELWAKKYKNTHIIGIDLNPNVISILKNAINNNNWINRVEALNIALSEYSKQEKIEKFDVILLNDVLHEIKDDENYRKNFMEQIYSLLKGDGILIVGETMMPDIFSIKRGENFWGSMKKWDEVVFGAKFYDENSFRDFILSTSFKHAELIKAENDNVGNRYIWAIKK